MLLYRSLSIFWPRYNMKTCVICRNAVRKCWKSSVYSILIDFEALTSSMLPIKWFYSSRAHPKISETKIELTSRNWSKSGLLTLSELGERRFWNLYFFYVIKKIQLARRTVLPFKDWSGRGQKMIKSPKCKFHNNLMGWMWISIFCVWNFYDFPEALSYKSCKIMGK